MSKDAVNAGLKPIKGGKIYMKARIPFLFALFITIYAAVFGDPYYVEAQATLVQPRVYAVSSSVIGWTAGTLNNGGKAVTVAAGTASTTTGQTDCSAPAFVACNIIWASSGGTVTVTAASAGIVTATAAGNSLMGFAETTTANVISKLSFPTQASLAYLPTVTLQDCDTSVTCATPTPRAAALKRFTGLVTVASGSAVTIAGLVPSYTSTATYGCSVTVVGTTSTSAVASYRALSTNQITLFVRDPSGASAPSESIRYYCEGY